MERGLCHDRRNFSYYKFHHIGRLFKYLWSLDSLFPSRTLSLTRHIFVYSIIDFYLYLTQDEIQASNCEMCVSAYWFCVDFIADKKGWILAGWFWVDVVLLDKINKKRRFKRVKIKNVIFMSEKNSKRFHHKHNISFNI